MPDLYELAARFRAELVLGERRAAGEMVRAYREAYRRLQADLARVQARIAEARRAGQEISPALLYRERRIQVLETRVVEEIGRFSRSAEQVVRAQAEAAATLGVDQAVRMIDAATPPGIGVDSIRLASDAVEQIVAQTQRETALGQLLGRLGSQAAAAVTDELVSGVALGRNPRVIASGMRDALGGNLTRALTISRTEVMRAWRESARETYRRNADVVSGWTWWSALDRRTCASCLAQHGTVHALDEAMATHPRCRCVAIPQPRSWRELGAAGAAEPRPPETGTSWFARQPVSVQRDVLGAAKLAAYRRREIALADLVKRERSPQWGPSTRVAGLRDAREAARRRRLAA